MPYIADVLAARQYIATGAHGERKSRKDVFLLYAITGFLAMVIHSSKRALTLDPHSQANCAKKATRA